MDEKHSSESEGSVAQYSYKCLVVGYGWVRVGMAEGTLVWLGVAVAVHIIIFVLVPPDEHRVRS